MMQPQPMPQQPAAPRYQDGEVKTVGGAQYVFQGGVWRRQGGAQPQQQPMLGGAPPGVRVVPMTQPDPVQPLLRQEQLTGERLDNRRTSQAIETNETPEEARARLAQEARIRQQTIARNEQEIAQGGERSAKLERSRSAALGRIETMLSAARRARDLARDGYFAVGGGGEFLRGVPGTTARALRGEIDTLGANLGFQELQEMRANSPTGGALGAVTERELVLLQSTLASLDQGADSETFQRRMEEIIGNLERSYADLTGETYIPGLDNMSPQQRAEALAARGLRETGGPDGGMERPMVARGPDPDQIVTGARSHDTPEIHEERLSAMQRYNYGLLRGVPDEQLVEILRSANLDPNGGNIQDQLRERRELGNREFRRRNRNLGINPSTYTLQPPDISDARSEGGSLGETLDATFRGITDTASLGFSDEFAAAGDTLANGGTYDDNLRRERAIADHDSNNNPISRLLGQFVGGFGLPVGQARTPGQLARVGASYGGGYGLGSGDGSVLERLQSAGTGAAVGGAGGYGFGQVGRLVGGRLEARAARRSADRPGADPAELMAAAQRQGIDILPADVAGPTVQRMTGGVGQSTFGSAPIVEAATRTGRQFQDRVNALSGAEGQAVRQEALGETVEGALDNFNRTSGQQGSEIYRGAREMADDALFQGPQASRFLNQQIRELSQTPNTSRDLIAGLSRLRDDVYGEGGGKSLDIDAIRRLRTNIRSEASTEGLRSTDYQRRANEALDRLSDDLTRQLSPAAAAEFRRADALWRQRLEFIDDVETRILGPKGDRSAEQVTRRLTDMSRSDSARFGRVLDQVTEEEAGIIRSSIIREQGRPPKGQPDEFSIATWAGNYRAMPERTRNNLYRGDARQHADDLLTIADGISRTDRFRNFSNSGGAIAVSSLLHTLGGGAGFGAAGPAGAVAGVAAVAGLERALGRALASPRVARMLARPPATQERLVSRLGAIAAREPALAPDISIITRALDSGARSAAAEDTQNPR